MLDLSNWHDVPIEPFSTSFQTGVDQQLSSRALLVCGWCFDESAGAAAYVKCFDGGDANGQPFLNVRLLPSQSMSDTAPNPGIYLRSGLHVQLQSGNMNVQFWVRILDRVG